MPTADFETPDDLSGFETTVGIFVKDEDGQVLPDQLPYLKHYLFALAKHPGGTVTAEFYKDENENYYSHLAARSVKEAWYQEQLAISKQLTTGRLAAPPKGACRVEVVSPSTEDVLMLLEREMVNQIVVWFPFEHDDDDLDSVCVECLAKSL